MTKRIEKARERTELARLTVQRQLLERKSAMLAKYDVVEPNRARRQPSRETKDEGCIYDMTRRLYGANLGRDLERNYSPARAIIHQMRVNVVGSLGKIRVNLPENAGEEATRWFNEEWSKDVDFREAGDWSTLLSNVVASVLREGDCLIALDDGIIENTGKAICWESDQIAPLSEKALKESRYPDAVQDNGILRDKWGRVVAYVTTGLRGRTQIEKLADAFLWAPGEARLVKNPWRLNQGRGIPALLTTAANFLDLYELLSSELQTAKRAAKQYANVKRSDAVTDWDSPATGQEYLPENSGKTQAEVAAEGANVTTATGAPNYEKLEAFSGGLVDYLQTGDEVQIPDIKHPNRDIEPFLEAVHGYGGAALGLARAYTILRADSSYTAFRGDMVLSWVTFKYLQKWLERSLCDWVGIKVLTWAQKQGKIAPLPAGWERSLSWLWPTMPEVNQVDYEAAVSQALKNGTTDYSQLLGPDYKRRLTELAKQVEMIRKLGLPLSIFETRSGGTSGTPPQQGDAAEPMAEPAADDGDAEDDMPMDAEDTADTGKGATE